ncbi:MAG TPA: hypothetical protein VNQ79_18660 [Blastocatellia bacterium]|nr:hypothetical protein [Blastocatellia bacterium]
MQKFLQILGAIGVGASALAQAYGTTFPKVAAIAGAVGGSALLIADPIVKISALLQKQEPKQ